MKFEDTLTDPEFVEALNEAQHDLVGARRAEPDLAVEGLEHSLFSRLVGLFTPRGGAS